MTKDKDESRNLNPHKEAKLAMLVWGEQYSKQNGGSMDFYDSLSDTYKHWLAEWIDEIEIIRHRAGDKP